MTAALETGNLCFRYPDGRAALDGVSLRLRSGERIALLGANGSGKTTLLLNLMGLLRPSSGEVRLAGEPIAYSRAGLERLRSRVGLVFQNPDSQLLSAGVAEDVSFGPVNLGLEGAEVASRVEAALAAVDMTHLAGVPAHALSFGEKKRVCIAGVLAMRPNVILLDEPTAGLDAPSVEGLLAVLARLHAGGMTIVMSTHDVDLAYGWADRAEVLDAGKLVASCWAEEFAIAFPGFARFGLARPRVADVYAAARRAGLARAERRPRTHAELLETLEPRSEEEAV